MWKNGTKVGVGWAAMEMKTIGKNIQEQMSEDKSEKVITNSLIVSGRGVNIAHKYLLWRSLCKEGLKIRKTKGLFLNK